MGQGQIQLDPKYKQRWIPNSLDWYDMIRLLDRLLKETPSFGGSKSQSERKFVPWLHTRWIRHNKTIKRVYLLPFEDSTRLEKSRNLYHSTVFKYWSQYSILLWYNFTRSKANSWLPACCLGENLKPHYRFIWLKHCVRQA